MDYCVAVRTGDKQKAGTNARVYITLIGTAGQTPEMRIDHPNHNDFERNTREEFNLSTTDVGELTKVRLRHDNSGKAPGWYLESVLVIRGSDGQGWEASPRRWLASTVPSDGGVDQTFPVTRATASFDYVAVLARLLDWETSEKSVFFLDPRARGITITLKYGATAALVETASAHWYLGAGSVTLPAGGEYAVSVGGYGVLAGSTQQLPEVWLAYSRLKA